MIRSWVAEFWSTAKGTLFGGVMRSRSSRWGEEEDARSYLESSLEVNRQAGVKCEGRVVPDRGLPEIFRHCGTIAQALNGKCFGCGKVLDQKDARAHKPVGVPVEKQSAGQADRPPEG